jgi:serine/threonine protein kinase/tetratricopeptide (TPR) repeat protein
MGRQEVFNRARFGDFYLDVRTGELRGDNGVLLLPQQVFHVLLLLVEREGNLVTREELRKKLWPNDTVVEFEHLINNTIKKLRRTLNDSADEPKYVGTVPRRGYRLLVPVEWVEEPPLGDSAGDESAPSVDADTADLPKNLKVGRLTGKIVSHYRVLEVIGGGGMGLVYRAEDLKLGRAVALKFLPEEVGDDRKARERFEREAKSVSALNHPNICSIYEFDEHDGHLFIVMELLNGKTLRDHLAEGRFRLAQPEGLATAVQIASGLEAAHEKGIIHRDIKPANIFITEKNVTKILDFGVAKVVALSGSSPDVMLSEDAEQRKGDESKDPYHNEDPGEVGGLRLRSSADGGLTPLRMTDTNGAAAAPAKETTLTRTGMKLGTAGYMSPEQIRGETLDARTDIFSFGLVLYEMATGERAFTGKTEAMLHEAIEHHDPKPMCELAPQISPKLDAIIAKCLEKEPSQRYQAVADLRTSLLELQTWHAAGHRIEADAKKPFRISWLAAVCLAVVVLAAAATALYRRMYAGPKLTDYDTIVIADFENKTSDPVFNGTFNPALEVALGQTPFLNPLEPEKISQVLKQLNKGPKEKLTADLGREVCTRTGSRALITGSISDVGNRYRIELRAEDCTTKKLFAEVSTEAASRDTIVAVLGSAVYQLRSHLGEPPATLRHFNKPLAEATTSSVGALRAFSSALSYNNGPEAYSYFKRATQLDPEFALAHGHLGLWCHNLSRSDAPFEISTAYQLRKRRLSYRDQITVEAAYYAIVTGEQDKVISALQPAVKEFPRWGRLQNILGSALCDMLQFAECARLREEVLRLWPEIPLSYVNLGAVYMALGRFDDAKAVLDQAKARDVDHPYLHDVRYRLAFLQGDEQAMEAEIQLAAGRPEFTTMLSIDQADVQAFYGHLHRADELLANAAEEANKAGDSVGAAGLIALEALFAARVGQYPRARDLVQRSKLVTPEPIANINAARASALAGDPVDAKAIAKLSEDRSPSDVLLRKCYLPQVSAAVMLKESRPADAIEELERKAPVEFPNACGLVWSYLRAEAYLDLERPQEAASQFDQIVKRPGELGWDRSHNLKPLALVQLARAYAMMGDTDAARKSYQDFLTLWKDADPDIPIYVQAKAEYKKLTQSSQISAVSHR